MRRILYRLKHSWCCITPRLLCRLLEMLILFLEAVLHLDDLKISQPVSDHVLPETIVEIESHRELIRAFIGRWRKLIGTLKIDEFGN